MNKRIGIGLSGVGAEVFALTGTAAALRVPRVATSVVAQIVLHVTKNNTDTVFAFGLLGPVEGVTAYLGGAVGEGVAADDVLSEHVAETFLITACSVLFADTTDHLGEKPLAAGFGVVGQDVDAVAGSYGDKALELPVGRGFDILQKGKFAAEDFDEEVAVAAGGLEEAAVEPERLIAHQVEHSVHLAGIGEHLAMVSHSLATFDLFCVFVVRHKKSWNFAYVHLGVPRPAQQLSKAHDYS